MTTLQATAPATETPRIPVTFKGRAPGELVGKVVRVRPFYLQPVEGSESAVSMRFHRSVPGKVTDVTPATNMVIVEHERENRWERLAGYYLHELHVHNCTCPACAVGGSGIHEREGA